MRQGLGALMGKGGGNMQQGMPGTPPGGLPGLGGGGLPTDMSGFGKKK